MVINTLCEGTESMMAEQVCGSIFHISIDATGRGESKSSTGVDGKYVVILETYDHVWSL